MSRLALAATLILSAALPGPLVAQDDPFLSVRVSEEWGPYVAGPEGRPVYAFVTSVKGGDDLPPLESCGPRCEEAWPRVHLPEQADPSVGSGLEQDLAAFVMWEGKPVATYDGRALFYYAREDDSPAPDGHGIHTFGGWWVLISPEGDLLHDGTIPDPEDY